MLSAVDRFAYPLGTQIFEPQYACTGANPRVESAARIAEMGSSVVKFALRRERCDGPFAGEPEASVTDVARTVEPVRELLDLPFAHTFLWAYARGSGSWSRVPDDSQLDREYAEMHELATYLLTRFNRSSRTFYLGNWEGDWHLTSPGSTAPADDEALDRLARRLNVRQRAIDDALRQTPHHDVDLFHYVEINRVQDAIKDQMKRIVNAVLPRVDIDLVSYSSYDSTNARTTARLPEALDFIERQLRPRPRVEAILGRRVFIGEYGYPASRFDELACDARSREVMKVALRWGCPFVLFWQMYNNERRADGSHEGYWLIDDRNRPTLTHRTHVRFHEWAREHVARSIQTTGAPPDRASFTAEAIRSIDRIGNENFDHAGRPAEPADRVARSLVHCGDPTRLHAVMRRAMAGQPVTLAGLGGSITQGAGAPQPGDRYLEQVAAWWRRAFPACRLTVVNAGIGATSSIYGCLRARRDLLDAKPDLVILDYGVNDGADATFASTYEGVIRQILAEPQAIALLTVFFMHLDGRNTQSTHEPIARHYGLPVVSYRDAFWPDIEADRLVWEDISTDDVHPNNRGHAATGQFIAHALGEWHRSVADHLAEPRIVLPEPCVSDRWHHTTLAEATSLTPVHNQGWHLDESAKAWCADVPGAVIEFEIEARAISFMWHRLRAGMGRAKVCVDSREMRVCDGWFPGTWGGYRESVVLVDDLAAGVHRLRVELLSERHEESTGHTFRILGAGTGR